MKSLRILHFPWNVGGHAADLAIAEREIGLNSRSVALLAAAGTTPADEVQLSAPASARAAERTRETLLQRALIEADVVHFTWGESLFAPPQPGFWNRLDGAIHSRLATYCIAQTRHWHPFKDLIALQKAGKVIAVTFMGDDLRQADRLRTRYGQSLADVVPENYEPAALDVWKRRQAKAFLDHAHIVYAFNPDLLHDLPRHARFRPYIAPTIDAPFRVRLPGKPLKIAHAPSDRRVKGTAHILAAVEAAKSSGARLELDIIENLPRIEAMARYAEADVVIDQMHAGFYGTFAVEAMALGKPVICYIRDADLKYLPSAMVKQLPILRAEPDSLTDVLTRLASEDADSLVKRGVSARQYADAWHSRKMIAHDMALAYSSAYAQISTA